MSRDAPARSEQSTFDQRTMSRAGGAEASFWPEANLRDIAFIKTSHNNGLLRAVTGSEQLPGVRRRRALSIPHDLDLRHPPWHAGVPSLLPPRLPAHAQGRNSLSRWRHPGRLAAQEGLVLAADA